MLKCLFADLYEKTRKLVSEEGWIYVVTAPSREDPSHNHVLYVGRSVYSAYRRISQHCADGDLLGMAITLNLTEALAWTILVFTPGECALYQNSEPHKEADHIIDLETAERYMIHALDPLFNWAVARKTSLEIPEQLRYAFEAYAPHIWRKQP